MSCLIAYVTGFFIVTGVLLLCDKHWDTAQDPIIDALFIGLLWPVIFIGYVLYRIRGDADGWH